MSTETNVSTPDYHLPYTGDEVEAGLKKAIELDTSGVGGVTVLTSPANLDELTEAGDYIVDYATAATFPAEFEGMTPIRISNTITADGALIQVIEAAGNKYYRYLTEGSEFSAFAEKTLNSGALDTTADPNEDQPSELDVLEESVTTISTSVTELSETVTNIQNTLENLDIDVDVMSLGTEANATAMLDGTYDYG